MYIKEKKQLNLLSIRIAIFICLSGFIGANAQQVIEERISSLDTSYLKSKNELEDYILDTGDQLNIEFIGIPELSGLFSIDEQGEIYFKRIKNTYIRGLTIKELTQLLEERYEEFLLNPEIYIRISRFKPIRVALRGEVRSSGILNLPSFTSTNVKTILKPLETSQPSLRLNNKTSKSFTNSTSLELSPNKNTMLDSSMNSNNLIKRNNSYLTTLSNAIQMAGGLTSYSDISKIEIIRDIPIGKGGGKKRAIINFNSYIKKADNSYDIRLFDGDDIFIPRLQEQDKSIIPNSILSGLSPKFINVSIGGRIEKPGEVRIPVEGSLSDVMNLSGPRKPLSGKIYLIRYNQDGTLLRKSITYSSSATPGSPRNPYLIAGDLITVKNSFLGKTSETLKTISEPFIGIYATKEVIETMTGKDIN